MKVITAPGSVDPMTDERPYVFLAGGISNCPDWQKEVIHVLNADVRGFTVINPRRENFPMGDQNAGYKQIIWEEFMINKVADIIVFYFPKETLCPITLFELGSQLMRSIPLAVHAHPEYKRSFDIDIQITLKRDDIFFHNGSDSLNALPDRINKLVSDYIFQNQLKFVNSRRFRG